MNLTQHIENAVEIDNVKEVFKAFFTLKNIPEDCPWSRYEAESARAFCIENFSALSCSDWFLQDLTPFVKEVGFVKIYSKKLKRDYWCVIYFLGEDEEGEPCVYVGGEPNLESVISDDIQADSSWREYPQFLREFWSVHGIFNGNAHYGQSTLYLDDITHLMVAFTHGEVPHADTMTLIKDIWVGDEIACFNRLCIDTEDEALETFAHEHLATALYFSASGTGDYISVLEDEDDSDHFRLFYMCHDGASEIYENFDTYFKRESSIMKPLRSVNPHLDTIDRDDFESLRRAAEGFFDEEYFTESLICFRRAFEVHPKHKGKLLEHYARLLSTEDAVVELTAYRKSRYVGDTKNAEALFRYVKVIENREDDKKTNLFYTKLMRLEVSEKSAEYYESYAHFLKHNRKDLAKSDVYVAKANAIRRKS